MIATDTEMIELLMKRIDALEDDREQTHRRLNDLDDATWTDELPPESFESLERRVAMMEIKPRRCDCERCI
jgi:hypothetical protein